MKTFYFIVLAIALCVACNQPPAGRGAGEVETSSQSNAQFKIEKVRMTEGVEEPVPYDQPVVWIVLEGQAEVRVAGVKEPTRFKGNRRDFPHVEREDYGR